MAKTKLPVLNIKNFKVHVNAQPDFYVKTFQQHKAEHPFVMLPHSHDFYMLMIVTKGKGTHRIELDDYPVKPGSVFFMSPSEVHSWQLSDDTEGYILFFNTRFYLMDSGNGNIFELPLYNPEHKIHSKILSLKQLPEFQSLMENIRQESNSESAYQKRILRSYLDILLRKLAIVFNINQESKSGQLTAALIPRLTVLINQHFSEHLPASFYANELDMNLQRLNAITKKSLNKTVAALIHERLLNEAKRLLEYSTFTISEVAFHLNFNDNSYFTRFFKKETGMTPEQYRKRMFYTTNS